MNINKLNNAHVCCSYNRKELQNSTLCGCFYCLKIFDPKLIVDWCDNNQTAICPYCGIDSIIYDSKNYHVSKEFLKEMKDYWF